MNSRRIVCSTPGRAGIVGNLTDVYGGAPITQDFADKVGADGFAADAGSASRIAKSLLGLA